MECRHLVVVVTEAGRQAGPAPWCKSVDLFAGLPVPSAAGEDRDPLLLLITGCGRGELIQMERVTLACCWGRAGLDVPGVFLAVTSG